MQFFQHLVVPGAHFVDRGQQLIARLLMNLLKSIHVCTIAFVETNDLFLKLRENIVHHLQLLVFQATASAIIIHFLFELLDASLQGQALFLLSLVYFSRQVDSAFFSGGHQQPLQLVVGLHDLLYHVFLRHALVYFRAIFDTLCTVCIFQGASGFFDARGSGSNCCNYASFCFATEGVLQQTGQLALPVRHMRLAFNKGVDHSTQGQE
mmetsp:Transcript_70672/g.118149  ORF Transcript_70672/g.118149 Transcript_70672/m.118149 type:complete len:208 (+) Transcript_70672:2293-2916(+)